MDFEGRYHEPAQRPRYDCLLFDLDDTLYPLSSGIAAECRKNIQDYMIERLGIESSIVPALCGMLYKHYGTTMAGLMAVGYNFDYDEYHAFVHGRLPYDRIKSDPFLRQLLLSLPTRKVIFTNADKVHAAEALGRLGLEDCFEGVICFETLNPSNSDRSETSEIFDIVDYFARIETEDSGDVLPKSPILCKPSESAMQHALDMANIDPQRTIFFDDSIRNIQSGKRIGLHTVLVGTSHRVEGADHVLESIHNIKEALPELWEEDEMSTSTENVCYSGKVTVETPVTA